MMWRAIPILALVVAASTAFAQSKPWDRAQQGKAIYAGTIDDRKNSVEIFCPETGNATLVVHSEQFRVSMPDDHQYTVTFVTANGRDEIVATSQDAELHFEAADLNASLALQRLAADIAASKSFIVSVSPFGWKNEFSAEGAAQALDGLLDRC